MVLIKNGWYFGQVFKISKLLDITPPNRLFMFLNFMQIRRKKIDTFFLIVYGMFYGHKIR